MAKEHLVKRAFLERKPQWSRVDLEMGNKRRSQVLTTLLEQQDIAEPQVNAAND